MWRWNSHGRSVAIRAPGFPLIGASDIVHGKIPIVDDQQADVLLPDGMCRLRIRRSQKNTSRYVRYRPEGYGSVAGQCVIASQFLLP